MKKVVRRPGFIRRLSHNKRTNLLLWVPLATFLTSLYVLFTLNPVRVHLPQLSKIKTLPTELQNYLVYTNGCKIPHTDAFDDSIKPFLGAPAHVACSPPNPLFESAESYLLLSDTSPLAKYFSNSTKLYCCYRPFWRKSPVGEDNKTRVEYAKTCVHIKSHATEIREEFIHVRCTTDGAKSVAYQDYFSFVPVQKLGPPPRAGNDAPPLNVLLMGLHSVSRLNLHRQMPKTLDVLRNLGAVELLGYANVDVSARANLLPLLTGFSEKELRSSVLTDRFFDSCPFVWKAFKQRGHVTFYGGDSTSTAPFDDAAGGFRKPPTDYYWDPFQREAESKIGRRKLFNSKLCLGSRHAHMVLLDFAANVASTMRKRGRKYFATFWFASFTQDDLNMPGIADDDFSDFLVTMEAHGDLGDTALVFFSDRGLTDRNVSFSFQGQLEERLPFLYVVLPGWFVSKHRAARENLEVNVRRLTTPFDVHRTLVDLLDMGGENGNEKLAPLGSRGTSLFGKVPASRTCKDGGVLKKRCACQRPLEVVDSDDKMDIMFNASAAAVVDWINYKLARYDVCSELSVKAIEKAVPMSNWDFVDRMDSFIDVSLVIRTEPGDGVFGATVRYFTGGEEEVGRTKLVTRVVRHDKRKRLENPCGVYVHLQPFCHCKRKTQNIYSAAERP